jgi:hypothetical protein
LPFSRIVHRKRRFSWSCTRNCLSIGNEVRLKNVYH